MSWEPSVLPLSATTTSPATPSSRKLANALRITVSRVSASLRQGRTTLSSTSATGSPDCKDRLPEGGMHSVLDRARNRHDRAIPQPHGGAVLGRHLHQTHADEPGEQAWGIDVVDALDIETRPFVCRAQACHRVTPVVPDLAVELAHGELEGGDEHHDGTARPQERVRRAERLNVLFDVLEDVHGDQRSVVGRVRGEHIDILHVDLVAPLEPSLQHRESTGVAVADRDLGGAGVDPGLCVVPEAAADLERVLAQIGAYQTGEPRVVADCGGQGLQSAGLQLAVP